MVRCWSWPSSMLARSGGARRRRTRRSPTAPGLHVDALIHAGVAGDPAYDPDRGSHHVGAGGTGWSANVSRFSSSTNTPSGTRRWKCTLRLTRPPEPLHERDRFCPQWRATRAATSRARTARLPAGSRANRSDGIPAALSTLHSPASTGTLLSTRARERPGVRLRPNRSRTV